MELREPISGTSSSADRIAVGMTVVDPAGQGAGTVTAVQPPGTDVRPDIVAGAAEHLMSTGYIRIDGTGELSNDTYASWDQIAGTVAAEPGIVSLRVPRGELHRATA